MAEVGPESGPLEINYKFNHKGVRMSKVRVLVGTKKGGVRTDVGWKARQAWEVKRGPHFAAGRFIT